MKAMPNTLSLALGCVLRVLRVREGWTQEEAAQVMGVSQQTCSRIELGTTDIRLGSLVSFEASLGSPHGEILGLAHTIEKEATEVLRSTFSKESVAEQVSMTTKQAAIDWAVAKHLGVQE